MNISETSPSAYHRATFGDAIELQFSPKLVRNIQTQLITAHADPRISPFWLFKAFTKNWLQT